METETYKVAKEILEKFGAEQLSARSGFVSGASSLNASMSRLSGTPGRPHPPGNDLRRCHTAVTTTAKAAAPRAQPPQQQQQQSLAGPNLSTSIVGDVANMSIASQLDFPGDGDRRSGSPALGPGRPGMHGGHLQRSENSGKIIYPLI